LIATGQVTHDVAPEAPPLDTAAQDTASPLSRALVTFVVPVRHQDNARDWGALKSRLRQTLASIANQTNPDWHCVIVCNTGADLPPLPDRTAVVRVSYPPNDLHDLGQGPRDAALDAFRLDKGRRVLAGMLAAPDCRYFMVVDDDDLLSNRIVAHVARNNGQSGWFVDTGFLWNDNGRTFFRVNQFDRICGTSLIVRRDLYALPAQAQEAEDGWIMSMLGSHVRIRDILAARDAPLAPLPFAGAAYRVASAGSHSRQPGILRLKFLDPGLLRRARRLLGNLLRLRWIGPRLRAEFFGRPPA